MLAARPSGANRYAYANNNPVRFTDPSGLLPGLTPNAAQRQQLLNQWGVTDGDRKDGLAAIKKILRGGASGCSCDTTRDITGRGPADHALGRLLDMTESSLFQNRALRLGSGGFASRFQDGSRGQGDHFLTGVNIFANTEFYNVAAPLGIGHEQFPELKNILQPLFVSLEHVNSFRRAMQYGSRDPRGASELDTIMPRSINFGGGSRADLNLTLEAARFAQLARQATTSVCDLVLFIENNLRR